MGSICVSRGTTVLLSKHNIFNYIKMVCSIQNESIYLL